jgi:hypothetical protein
MATTFEFRRRTLSTVTNRKSGRTGVKFAQLFLVDGDNYYDDNLLDVKVNTTAKDMEGTSDKKWRVLQK